MAQEAPYSEESGADQLRRRNCLEHAFSEQLLVE
jgi:hypothetical protein